MLNRFFSYAKLTEMKVEDPEYDLKHVPETEIELNQFLKYVDFVMHNMNKRDVTYACLRELVEWDGSATKYGEYFHEFMYNSFKVKPKNLQGFIKEITHPFGYLAYRYGIGGNDSSSPSYDEYTDKCLQFFKEAAQLPSAPELLDIRTMCYQVAQQLAAGKISTKPIYNELLAGYIKRIEAVDALIGRYMPPAEWVYQIPTLRSCS